MAGALMFGQAVGGVFVALVLAQTAMTLWLSRAQSLTVAREREEVPKAFADVLTLAAHHRAADYTRAKENLSRRVACWDALMLLNWTLLGALGQLDHLITTAVSHLGVENERLRIAIEACLLLSAFGAVQWALDLPVALWRTFKIEQRFGFNRTTPKTFWGDQGKGALLGALIGWPIFALVVLCFREGGTSPWAWLWAWGTYAAFTLVLVWLGPRVIAPMFNTFRPLTDGEVLERVDGLMRRSGYRHGGLYVMDGSVRSTHGNAYFTGLGRAKRVVFFDTLLKTLMPEEVEAVLAHELGHFALGHIQKQLVASLALGAVAFFCVMQGLMCPSIFAPFGLAQSTLAARLLGLMLLLGPLTFWLTPLRAWLSRRREYEADAYACQHASGTALSRALLKLFVDNGATLTPHRSYARFYNSHPPAVERLNVLARCSFSQG